MPPLLIAKNLKKIFQTSRGNLHAVDDVSFHVDKGETLGLVGESGCGKSTLGRLLIRLLDATEGDVIFDGLEVLSLPKDEMKMLRRRMQIVFQDPYSSLSPRLSVSDLIAEPLSIHGYESGAARMNRVRELMEIVGLAKRLETVYPHELDGGRRQRIGIARALALNPEFIVLDEPVSALDVCIQAQVLNLLNSLKKDFGYTYVFISHNLSVVRHVSDRIAVMYLGEIVELSDYRKMFENPLHPYTQALLSAIPIAKVGEERKKWQRERIILEGEVPSPIEPPEGCRFAPRCTHKNDSCDEQSPRLVELEPEHFVACHRVGK